ncbi:MerR family transcriptional regulator [Streptomyces sp. ST2-7A]|uniref:MerR family transcriptional regulator n=1 Tax=Streptomyces sp. ST2-7A TaxID=2907214 RepID=UPI002278D622
MTTGAVSKRFGVAPTTLRSWDRRYGIGPAGHTGGRHRRWTPEDIAVLAHMCRLTSEGVPPAEAAAEARRAAGTGGDPMSGPAPGDIRWNSGSDTPESARKAAGSAGAPPRASAGDAPTAGRTTAPTAGTTTARTPNPTRPADVDIDTGRTGKPESDGEPSGGTAASDTPGGTPRRTPAGGGNTLPLGENVHQECRGLARAAVRLDAPTVQRRLEAAIADHGLVTAWNEVIMPALRAVGRKWQTSGERYVEVEHLLSWHVSSVLRLTVARAGVPAAGSPVVLACTPNELHTLPLEAVSAGLAERDVPQRMFGAAVPAEALFDAVRRTGPAAVALWSQSRGTADRAMAHRLTGLAWGIRGARTRPKVLTLGPGWSAGPTVPGTRRPTTLGSAVDLLVAASVGAGADAA